jgi:hypothetical protein
MQFLLAALTGIIDPDASSFFPGFVVRKVEIHYHSDTLPSVSKYLVMVGIESTFKV